MCKNLELLRITNIIYIIHISECIRQHNEGHRRQGPFGQP